MCPLSVVGGRIPFLIFSGVWWRFPFTSFVLRPGFSFNFAPSAFGSTPSLLLRRISYGRSIARDFSANFILRHFACRIALRSLFILF